MKKITLFTLFLVSCQFLSTNALKAQTVSDEKATTMESITTHLKNSGRVAVYHDPRLEALISSQPKTYNVNVKKGKNGDVIVTSGYRIRAFSGNNQVTSKNQAYKIEKDLKQYMPDLATYVVFKSPNWRLLVGNYTTSEEAISKLRELKKSFPEYGKEMFVVKDEIEISR